jgi:hypothetical protein
MDKIPAGQNRVQPTSNIPGEWERLCLTFLWAG